jgi:hypothetical protein
MPPVSTLIRTTTLRVAGAVAALAVAAPFTAPADARGVARLRCGRSSTLSGSGVWQSFPAPTFSQPAGITVSQGIVSFSVSPSNTQLVAVTNGNSVYVSRDGGCTWTLALRLDQVPDVTQGGSSGATATIKKVYVSPGNAFFAMVEDLETGATVGSPHILRSGSGAVGTWQLADTGLPPVGKPLLMRGHRTNPNVLYLTFAGAREEAICDPLLNNCVEGDRLGLMYASTDGGRTWESRTDPGDLNSVAEIRYFSVEDDDRTGNTVWVVANGLLRRSSTGGRTFEAPDGLDQQGFSFTAVESLANTVASGQLKLVAFSGEGEMIRLHRGRWVRSRVPFAAVESVAQRPEGDIAVATTPGGGAVNVWRIFPKDFFDYEQQVGLGGQTFRTTYGWESVTPPTVLSTAANITAGDSPVGDGTYYVRDQRRVLRFLGSAARRDDTSAPPITVGAPPPPVGKISPTGDTLDIPMGKSLTVDYRLTLPPAPTPIDLYLLVDNSGSMSPTIEALKSDLGEVARSLVSSGVDVNIGIGQINVQPDRQTLPIDDPRTEEDESKPKPIYQRLRAIGPVNPDLFRQLSRLDGNGGSGSEPQLEALWQAVNGDGLSFSNLGWLVGYSIPKGQHAGFRDALSPIKVIVHATDEQFSRNIDGAHNEFGPVAASLRQAGVKQIGLSQGILPNPHDDERDAYEDLSDMARLTGAIAPAGGTDCDGDGRIGAMDLRAGQPLVCTQSYGLDKTLVNLIRSLSDPQVITLSHNAAPTIAEVTREEFRIDAKKATSVGFTVTYSCKGLAAGQYVNEFTASLRSLSIAKGVTYVNCGGVSVRPPASEEEPVANPPLPQPQPLVPAPAPVNPVPQMQTQVQAQTNPQAGLADQEQEQIQLALADNGLLRDDEELSMTRLAYEDNPAVVLGLGMTMAAVAGGVMLRRRTRTRHALARARVRP